MEIRVCINGMGRIGRTLFKLISDDDKVVCTHINEPNATTEEIVYFLKYDSLYGRFVKNIDVLDEKHIQLDANGTKIVISVSHYFDVEELCSDELAVDYYIDASGKINEKVKYEKCGKCAIFTCCIDDSSDREFIINTNDEKLDCFDEKVMSGSICDAVAIAPVLKAVYDTVRVKDVMITTMHPALSYQKVIDNYPEKGYSVSLGRQYIDSIIPKRTSVENVLNKMFINQTVRCLSFRIPTESVCAADITISAREKIDFEKVMNSLKRIDSLDFSSEELVSIDFKGKKCSATIDMRWTEKTAEDMMKIILWYDNEVGYSDCLLRVLKKWDESRRKFIK